MILCVFVTLSLDKLMEDFEKLGVFYLGREYDLAGRTRKEDLVLYDSKDLVTHAVCVGMTGSGKTGLCLCLLEEPLSTESRRSSLIRKATFAT